MQVKKFEAPTIQEALDTIKRELGPEAIILQTKKNKRGFGLMSKESVEVTAAVSERSIQKKEFVEKRLPEPTRNQIKSMPAVRQAEFIDKYAEKHTPKAKTAAAPIDLLLKGSSRDQVQVSPRAMQSKIPSKTQAQSPAQSRNSSQSASTLSSLMSGFSGLAGQAATTKKKSPSKRLTTTRYIDIDQHEVEQRHLGEERSRNHQVINEGALENMSQPTGTRMSLEEELHHLKRMIEEMKVAQDKALPVGGQPLFVNSGSSNAAQSKDQYAQQASLNSAFEQLILNGMDKRYAYSLIKQVSFELGDERSQNPDEVLDQLAAEIMQSTEIRSPLAEVIARKENPEAKTGGPVVIALVGPTGVGKTTTVAKMASEALLKRNLRVGLINLDSYKVAAFDQLGTYGKILNVPFRSCATGDDLRAAIQDFQSLDLVLVDTTGRSQRDPDSLNEMQSILSCVPQLRTQLVLSVTTRDGELYDMANRFSMFRPQGIIVSKLDEATIYGSIYNVSQKVKLPLLYFTTGQRVPEDIEEASQERVAALILDI